MRCVTAIHDFGIRHRQRLAELETVCVAATPAYARRILADVSPAATKRMRCAADRPRMPVTASRERASILFGAPSLSSRKENICVRSSEDGPADQSRWRFACRLQLVFFHQAHWLSTAVLPAHGPAWARFTVDSTGPGFFAKLCGATLISPHWVMTAAYCVTSGTDFRVCYFDRSE